MRLRPKRLACLLVISAGVCQSIAETVDCLPFPRERPADEGYDVVVAGGGSAAVSAAIAAKRAGATVLVVASRPSLSDDLAGKLELDPSVDGRVAGGFAGSLVRLKGAPFANFGAFTPLQLKRHSDEMLMRAGIPFRTFTSAVRVLRTASGEVCGLLTVSRGGERIVLTKCVVDATERAALTRSDGAEVLPFGGGRIAFTRNVIAGFPPKGPALSVVERPSRNTEVAYVGVAQDKAQGVVTGRYFRCTAELEVEDLSARALQRVEQRLRDLTWEPTTLDAADTVSFFPPDRIVRTRVGLFVASLVGERDEDAARRRFADLGCDVDAAAQVGRRAAAFALARQKLQERPARQTAEILPVLGSADVFVAGLGTGGAPAAITAAREGCVVIGCDFLHRMGGLMTEGLIGSYCCGYRGGFTAEIDRGVRGFARVYSVGKAEWFRQEAIRAGAELWFGASVTGVRKSSDATGNRLTYVEVTMPDGSRGLVAAKVFIDATGNADLAAAAGEEVEFIRSDELSLQGAGSTQKLLGSSYRNSDWNFVDDTDAADLAFFTLRARTAMALWAWDQAQMVNSRERRRLCGVFSVSVQDIMLGRTYPDTVAVTRSNFDTHGQTTDTQFFVDDPGREQRMANLPYRCLLPKRLDGLLVIGLGMSAHRDAMPILRMQPDVQNQGYVAGLAASQSIREGVAVRHVNMMKLQHRLVEKGVLPPEQAGRKDSLPLSDADLASAADALPDGYGSLAELLSDRERSRHLLRMRLANALPDQRLCYAHVLGLLGDADGAHELILAIRKMSKWDAGWNYRGMGQFGRSVSWLDSYLIALGRTRAREGFDVVAEKSRLLSAKSAYSHFRAVALALEAIGDKRGVPELARLLALPGVAGHAFRQDDAVAPVVGYGNYSQGNLGMCDRERSDCLRELCLARALFRLGDTADAIGRKTLKGYLTDPRKSYANHAKQVLRSLGGK